MIYFGLVSQIHTYILILLVENKDLGTYLYKMDI